MTKFKTFQIRLIIMLLIIALAVVLYMMQLIALEVALIPFIAIWLYVLCLIYKTYKNG